MRTTMINWKEIPKIDAHIHLTPDDVIEANKDCGSNFIDYGSVDDYIRIMKKYNIEQAFVMPFNDPCMLSMDFKVETANDNLRTFACKDKTHFKCFADVDISKNLEQTLDELKSILKQEEFIGIKIHPSNTGYPVDGMYYDRIFQFACDNNYLVEIHSYPRMNLEDDVCSPSRIRTIKEKYPKLRLSVAHMGGMQYKNLTNIDAYLNISAVLPDWVKKYGIKETNAILRSFDMEKLIFATDYPDSRCLEPDKIYEEYFNILGKMDFSRQEAENICKHNALKMIKF